VGSTVTKSGGQLVKVQTVTLHPSYGAAGNTFDVAVLKLSQPLQFNENVKSVLLDDAKTRYSQGTQGVISGWGTTRVSAPVGTKIYWKKPPF
jgi:Trypsin